MIHTFTFYCICAHLDLHSFPTRRSSDLYGRGGRQKIETDNAEFLTGVRMGKSIASPITMLIPNKDNRDRKSTRLNSSHPSISYAVFCLKKKINRRLHFTVVHVIRTLPTR